jgi:hypothetical protein
MALWSDTVQSILDVISGAAVYNTNNSATPQNFTLVLLNMAKDLIAEEKQWNDLQVRLKVTLDSEKKITLPADYGAVMDGGVFVEDEGSGKPTIFFSLNSGDITTRYTIETTEDPITGVLTRKFCFPSMTAANQNLYIVYLRVLPDYTMADVNKVCMFPKAIMLAAAKKLMLDNFGVAGNEEPNWINLRYKEELKKLVAYTYNNNVDMDLTVHDRNGNPVFINGMAHDGSRGRLIRPSSVYPSTFQTGGVY